MTVASDASPLVHVARIGRLDLLRALYGEVLTPEAVWHEVTVAGAGLPGDEEVRAALWARPLPIANEPLAQALMQTLDAGEAEAIVLALEHEADFVLMDERLGRAAARHMRVTCIGLVGGALEAKRRGLLPAVGPFLDALRDRGGFYLGEALYRRVLRDEGKLD